VSVLHFFDRLVILVLHGSNHRPVLTLCLVLALILRLLKLLYDPLELNLSIIKVFFVVVSLLLQELEFTLPQGLILVIGIDLILVLSVKFIILSLPFFNLL
jgi:hypothetical protein